LVSHQLGEKSVDTVAEPTAAMLSVALNEKMLPSILIRAYGVHCVSSAYFERV
jgi:hypothetical protein